MTYPFLKAHSAENTAYLVGKFTDDNGEVFDKRNQWNQIFDFTKETGQNFKLMEPREFTTYDISEIYPDAKFENYGGFVMDNDWMFDLPVEFGGNLQKQERKANDGLMAFDIKTGAKEA